MSTRATGRPGVWSHCLVGLSITAICTGIAFPVYPYLDPVNIVMVYLLGATLSGLMLGRGASALTAVANTAAFDFFFVPPRVSFYVAEGQYVFTMGVMLGVALIIPPDGQLAPQDGAAGGARTANRDPLRHEMVPLRHSIVIVYGSSIRCGLTRWDRRGCCSGRLGIHRVLKSHQRQS